MNQSTENRIFRGLAAVVLVLLVVAWLMPIIALAVRDFDMAGAASGGQRRLSATLRFGWNSFYVSALAALMATLYAILPSYWLATRCRAGLRNVLLVIAVLPLFVSPAVFAVAAIRLSGFFSGRFGPQVIDSVYTFTGAAIILAWAGLPLAVLTQFASWRRIDGNLLDAARLEAKGVQHFLRCALPMVLPGVTLGFVLVFMLSLIDFNVGESLRSLPLLVARLYVEFGVYYNPQGAVAIAALLGLMGALGVAAIAFFARKNDRSSELAAPITVVKNGWQSGFTACLLLFPLLLLVGILLYTATDPQGRWTVLARTAQAAWEEVAYSLRLGVYTAILAIVFGAMIGWAVSRSHFPIIWRIILLLAFMTPGPVIAIGLKFLLLQEPGGVSEWLNRQLLLIDDSVAPLLFAWTLRFVAIPALLVDHALRAIPATEREAYRLESRNPLRALAVYILPATALPLIAGGFIVFALTFSEVGAAVLLIPPGPTTVGVRLMTLMHYAPAGEVSALCLLITLPGLLLGGLALALFALRRDRQ